MSEIEFLKCMKILQSSYMKEFDEDTIRVWYMQFRDISYDILLKSINKIIRTMKFMPSISQLLEECENQRQNIKFDILEKMYKDGYFEKEKDYEKMNMWFQEGIIPKWFREDMKKYYQPILENKEQLKLE